MLSLEEARERLLAAVHPLPGEALALVDAAGRYLARDLTSPVALPSFDNSAMDGYAVIAADVKKSTAEQPVTLVCLGATAAGEPPGGPVRPGCCWRVFTGAPMPAGANAVVMQEDTRVEAPDTRSVTVTDAVRPWENVRLLGEDVKQGATIAFAGRRLEPGGIALVAASGIGDVFVGRRPVVAVISTGDELLEPGEPLRPGKVYESNRVVIETLVRRAGGEVRRFAPVPDNPAQIGRALATAFAECDAVITSGGVSVGAHDHVRPAFEALGGQLNFWRVAIRPGKPFVHGQVNGRHFFGLPGNPVSAVVTFLLLVRPALIRLQGGTELQLPITRGVLADALANRGDRRHFVRVTVSPSGDVAAGGAQGSHMLSSLAAANGLVDLPPGAAWEAGREVSVLLIKS